MSIFLAISLSLDALTVGISMRANSIKINIITYIMLFVMSFFIIYISIIFGEIIFSIFPINFIEILGSIGIIFIGIFVLFNSLRVYNNSIITKNSGFYRDFVICIILSIDSFLAGFTASALGLNSIYLGILVATFQVLFLYIGNTFSVILLKIIDKKILGAFFGTILVILGIFNLA